MPKDLYDPLLLAKSKMYYNSVHSSWTVSAFKWQRDGQMDGGMDTWSRKDKPAYLCKS